MGRHLFRNDWHETYSGVLLPHPPAARELLDSDDATEDQRRVIGDPTSEHYENGSAKVGHGSGVIISLRAA